MKRLLPLSDWYLFNYLNFQVYTLFPLGMLCFSFFEPS